MKYTFLVCVVLIGGILWFLDVLATSESAIEDDEDNVIGYKPSKYTGIWDYIKKKYNEKGGIR